MAWWSDVSDWYGPKEHSVNTGPGSGFQKSTTEFSDSYVNPNVRAFYGGGLGFSSNFWADYLKQQSMWNEFNAQKEAQIEANLRRFYDPDATTKTYSGRTDQPQNQRMTFQNPWVGMMQSQLGYIPGGGLA